MASTMATAQYQLWQTNSAVSTHDSWYATSDDEQEAAHPPPPAASPAASPAAAGPVRTASIFDGHRLSSLSSVSSACSAVQTGSCDSAGGVQQLRTLSVLSDVANASVLSENVDINTPQVELSFGPAASTRGPRKSSTAAAAAAAAAAPELMAAGPGSPTVGDWTATLEYVLEDTKRARAFGHCLQAGVVDLTRQVTSDDENHVSKEALDALQSEVQSADAYGLEAGAAVLADAICTDSIPVKLKALNVLVRDTPHARHVAQQLVAATAIGVET
eukprot:COSAG06_NODE_583_length_14006_cov_10.629251_5_plen_274_part_00